MGANLYLKYMTLSFLFHSKYHRLKLVNDGDHVYLPFTASTVVLEGNNGGRFQSGTSSEVTHVTQSMNQGIIFYSVSQT